MDFIHVVRVVAIFFVIMIHVSVQGFYSFSHYWWAINFYESLSRIGVPLFFMASGALLLPKTNESISVFFKKRAAKISIPFIVWSYIYLVWRKYDLLEQGVSFHPKVILEGPAFGHLWFMYTLIGLYIAMPIFQKLYQVMTKNDIRYLLVCWYLGASILFIFSIVKDRTILGLDVNFIPPYAGFLFLGAAISTNKLVIEIKPILAIGLYGIGTLLTAFLTIWYSSKIGKPIATFYKDLSPTVIITSIGMYYYIKNIAWKTIHPFIKSLSDASFGIYLCHYIILVSFLRALPGSIFDLLHPIISIPLLTTACLITSYVVVIVIKRIPILRYIV